MAESTLSLSFWDVVERVSDYLGYGSALLGDGAGDNFARVRRCVEDGYRQFLFPMFPGEKQVHQWHFLRPHTTLLFITTQWEYTLPDDFGGLIGEFVYPAGTAIASPERVEVERILQMRAGSTSSGDPYYYALRPVALTAATGQRWQVIFYPTPSTAHTMLYRYRVMPGKWGNSRLSQSCTIADNKGTGTTATCSIATVTVTDTAASFVAWGVWAGDPFTVTDGTATAGDYVVSSVTDATHLVLTASAGTGTASYIVGTSYVTLTGAGSYTTAAIVAGDRLALTGAGGPTEGIYTVLTKDSATRLTLTASAGASGTMNAETFPATLYHYGGLPHSKTLLESCLQQAELQVNDIGDGPHGKAWIMELARSLAIDRETGADILGYNGDDSDGREWPYPPVGTLTVGGVVVYTP